MVFPAKRVPPYRLWIGGERDSLDAAAARRHGIGLVVNCTRDLPFALPAGVRRVRVPVDDAAYDNDAMLRALPRAVHAIDAALAQGRGVLVHCFAGVSRSASVVAAYLVFRERLTPRQAVARVRAAKPVTFSNGENFMPALEAFYRLLRQP